jgi:Na+/H+-dicarboxylate symporter
MLTGAMILALPLGIAVFSWMSRIVTVRPELPPGAAEAASSLATSATPVDFGSWLISLVPTNPVAAAANGAMLPLVIFTVLLALAIAQAPADGRDVLLRFFRGLGDAMQVLVRWVIWCAPVGIFALMLPLGAHGGAGFVGAVGFYIAAYSLASILFVLLLYPAVALFARLPIARVRPRGTSWPVDRVFVELVDRVTARARPRG